MNSCKVTKILHKISGARNHKYFIGFLISLVGLCGVIIAASFQYWRFECWTNLTEEDTPDNYFIAAATCDSWVMWVAINTALHFLWVGTLLACQSYQVSFSKFTFFLGFTRIIKKDFLNFFVDLRW